MDEDRVTLLEAKVKELKVQLASIESNVKINDCGISETVADQEDADGKIEKLQERLTHLEWDLEPSISRLDIFKRTSQLEESIEVLKVQNIELRDHLNLVVNMVNNITSVLNNEQVDEPVDEARGNTQADNEPTDEAIVVDDDDDEPATEDNEPMQWDEMASAIEAAEQHEARKKKSERSY